MERRPSHPPRQHPSPRDRLGTPVHHRGRHRAHRGVAHMIAAVSTMLNEADIAHRTVAHLFNSGVDEIYIALSTKSSDGTRESLAPFPVTIIDDTEEYHYQPRWTNYLAGLAAEHGATWIIPFDADEFIYPVDGTSIPDALARVTSEVKVLAIASHQHLTLEERFTDALGLGKVAY